MTDFQKNEKIKELRGMEGKHMNEIDLLKGLNPSQLCAVKQVEGIVQVNACAGSGKSTTLVHRIAYMLQNGVKPNSILCTTFTKKSAEDMTEKLSKLITKMQLMQITIGTSHSIFYRILKKELTNTGDPLAGAFKQPMLINSTLKIFADKTKQEIVRDIKVPMNIKQLIVDTPLSTFIRIVSLAKNENLDVYGFRESNSKDRSAFNLACEEYYERYENRKHMELKIDADDLLFLAVKLFKQHPAILKKYQQGYKYIMIDESQDNNSLQYNLFKQLSKPQNNLFLVGDDDQCQPAGEQVLTTDGYVNIEDLNSVNNKLISFNRKSNTIVGINEWQDDGYPFEISSREYIGNMFEVLVSDKITHCTNNHKWLIKWSDSIRGSVYAVYMMRKDDNFRVGWCKMFLYNGSSNMGYRARHEKTDSMWILKLVTSKESASAWESIISVNYGIPLTPFIGPAKGTCYSQENLNFIFNHCECYDKAIKCLSDYGRDIDYPLYSHSEMNSRMGATTVNVICACNLISDYMTIPVHVGKKEILWESLQVSSQPFSGTVYSLSVKPHETYIVNGLITHNCMYGFRGSRPDKFIHFKDFYKGIKEIPLEQNYRSKPDILRVANKLIAHNTERLIKKLIPNRKSADKCVFYDDYKNEEEEAIGVLKDIKTVIDLEQGELDYKKIAILYRTNAQSRSIEEQLIVAGLPYVIYGGISFYERKEVKDIIAYLRLAVDHTDNDSFIRCINTPSRYLGKAFLYKVKEGKDCYFNNLDIIYMKNYEKAGVAEFKKLIQAMSKMLTNGVDLEVAVNYLLNEGKYEKYITEDDAEGEEGNSKMEIINTLLYVLSKYPSIQHFFDYLDLMTEDAKLDVNGIQLMSIHRSKGLEFPIVFLIGASQGILPHFKALEAFTKGKLLAIEEERRLAYVAVTRAKDQVYISSIETFNGKETSPSTFIKDMSLVAEIKEEEGQ